MSGMPISITFDIADLTESLRIAARYAGHGLSMRIDLTDECWQEILVVGLHDVALFEVWPSSAAFTLRYLLVGDGSKRHRVPSMAVA